MYWQGPSQLNICKVRGTRTYGTYIGRGRLTLDQRFSVHVNAFRVPYSRRQCTLLLEQCFFGDSATYLNFLLLLFQKEDIGSVSRDSLFRMAGYVVLDTFSIVCPLFQILCCRGQVLLQGILHGSAGPAQQEVQLYLRCLLVLR